MIDDPLSLLSLGIWLMAAGMWPVGFLFGACSACCGGGGCTNPYAVNYDSEATCDDGSCVTCCTRELCRLGDDCKGEDCRSATDSSFFDCCDSGCLPCVNSDGVETGRDCHTSFDNLDTGNFVAIKCDGTELIYHDCFNCPTAEVVPP
jgi:hypothetical protein